MKNQSRTGIKQRVKIRSLLQKEIGSQCPICFIDHIEHFEIHHIDENSLNNEISNLILLCSICHSKITKGDITNEEVVSIKSKLINGISKIECAFIKVDAASCSWIPYDDYLNAFKEDYGSHRDPFPILEFSLINHNSKTILLNQIELRSKTFPSISGPSRTRILKSIAKYDIPIPLEGEKSVIKLKDEIEVPPHQAFKFKIQVYQYWNKTFYPLNGYRVLYFTLKFNSQFSLELPKVFLNCIDDSPRKLVFIN